MKKLILSLTIVSLLIFPLGAAALTQSQQESLPAVSTEEVHGNVPAQTDAAQAMTPAVHALVLAMTENHLDYDPSDSEFLWTSLYYMLSLYGQMDERAEFTDDTMILPSEMAPRSTPMWLSSPRSPLPSPSGSLTSLPMIPIIWRGAMRLSFRSRWMTLRPRTMDR